MTAVTDPLAGELVGSRSPYAVTALQLLRDTGCTVRRWRSSPSGRASIHADDWGIVVPRPTSPLRFFVFAHEVGHQVRHRKDSNRAGLPRHPRRWEQEIEADEFAADQFLLHALPGLAEALRLQEPYLAHALLKSLRVSADKPAALAMMEARILRGPLAPMIPDGVLPFLQRTYARRTYDLLPG